jgi:hypothetical protein
MSNKQQTAVEWLNEQLQNNVHHTIRIPSDIIQQAKEMEKLQLQHAQCDGAINWDGEQTFEQYYNETYGEDNYSENLEQWAWDNPCLSRSDVYNLFEEVFKTKRLTFDKTYAIGASKEVSDFQNKLRKLAKDKSELLQKSI